MWFGGLLLLVGCGADLFAQDMQWRTVPPPSVPTPNSAFGQPAVRVSYVQLGRPTASTVDTAARSSVVPVSYAPPAVLASSVRNSPDLMPEEDTEAGQFASDRAVLARTPPPAASIGIAQTSMKVADPGSATGPGPMLPPPTTGTSPFPPPAFIPPDGDFGPPPDIHKPCFYVQGEYLLWLISADHVPPLLTTGPASAGPNAGVLGQNGTQILFGGGGINDDLRSGFRFTAGFWVDDGCQDEGFEFRGFVLGGHSTNFTANSADNGGVLARPFFNLNTGKEDVEFVAFPGLATGSATVRATSNLYGLEGNYRLNCCCDCCQRLDVIAGFRYLNLNESITISESIVGDPNAPVPTIANKNVSVIDQFSTRNSFYGGQVGLIYERPLAAGWSLGVRGTVAVGDTHQELDIAGSQTVVDRTTGTVTHFTGGLFTAPTNIGHFTRDRFSVVPELGLTASYQLNDHWRLFGGFNGMYWSNVIRPGNQIDRTIDTTNVPNLAAPGTIPTGTNHPAVLFKESNFWATGLNIGAELRF
jgi:hypothetical protein